MKKYFTFNVWIVIFLGFIVLLLLGKFNGGNSEPNLITSVLFVLAFLSISLSILGYILISMKDYFFRSHEMCELAQKYNLTYTKPEEPFIELTFPESRRRNIIEGKINGKNILVYDLIDYKAHKFGAHANDSIAWSSTLIFVDGKETEMRGFFTGVCSVKKIDYFLGQFRGFTVIS